jgi:DNA repair exonuclease SbcCD nuclease subunit
MALARFLQVSDLHLGTPLGWLPADRRDERRRDQRAVLERAVREAIERGVHAILIPGDLFDQEGVDAATLTFALHAFDVNGCPPVFIAPGNHDPWSESSLYWSERLLKARGMRWPAHVHIFSSAQWTARPLAALKGVRIWGRCFIGNVESLERPLTAAALAQTSETDPAGFDLAVFHGTREAAIPPMQKKTAPFSDEEVAESPFAYLAVGHHHVASELPASGPRAAGVRLAFAGSAAALNPGEAGVHGALEVRIEYGRRQPFIEIEPVQLDKRRVFQLKTDLSLATSAEQVDRRVLRALDEAGVTEQDIATVEVFGRLARGVRLGGAGPELKARAFYLRLDPRRLRPDYDLDQYRSTDAITTEDRFARALIEMRDKETDPRKQALFERALYYGLDAFRLREVTPAYEELGT